MLTLYPSIKPYAEHVLDVDDIHTIFVEECGNPEGVPVLFLHGGPGSGCDPDHRRFFDPQKYRIILFDQRGCGRSKPHMELTNNTTSDLVSDMETIRKHLKVDKWVLFGGSWGGTLALIYAQSHPTNVLGLILRGVFLGRKKDLDWLYKAGCGAPRMFPEHWEEFLEHIPNNKQHDVISAYHEILIGDNEVQAMAAAKAWALWEAELTTLEINPKNEERFTSPQIAHTLAAIETHYFCNSCFIEENQIIDDMATIENIPGIIIHARYDMVCALDNAYDLHKKWPTSKLEIIRRAGHHALEPAITTELVRATNEMLKLVT